MTTGGERNITCPQQLRQLTATLRAASARPPADSGGSGGRARSAAQTAKRLCRFALCPEHGTGQPDKTRALARQLGKELAGLGISVDLAPVADVNSNPANPAIGALERSFSPNPTLVAAHAIAFGQGLAQQGVTPALKHFPGQGGAQRSALGFDRHHPQLERQGRPCALYRLLPKAGRAWSCWGICSTRA